MLKKFAAAGIVTAAAAGVMLLAGPASADVNTDGIGNGIGNVPVITPIEAPVNAPINAPIDVCGNNTQIIGAIGGAGCQGDVQTTPGY